jgi:hypothetical protein
MNLFQLTEQYRSLLALADSETDIPPEVLNDTLEGLGGELQLKANNIARFIANQDAYATAIEEASAAMTIRAKRLRARMDHLRTYLLNNLQASGITKIDTPELVVSVKKNPASVVIDDEKVIPPEFMVTPPPAPPPLPRPDKGAIRDAIKAGTDVPGCRLVQGARLEIRP